MHDPSPIAAIPHEEIRSAQDRNWTERLLARLTTADLPADEREQITSTLEVLADPRAEAPLAAILADRSQPKMLRRTASFILRECDAVDRAGLPATLRDGDFVEQRHALLAMDHGEADVVTRVAADPAHPLHEESIRAMEFGFEEPRHQALKIAALAHGSPAVRETAAQVLRWDEPVAAEEALLRATLDPIDAVAIAAADTLRYYPSRRVVMRLAEMRGEPGRRGEMAVETIRELVVPFACALRDAEGARRRALIEWMKPIWDVLEFTDEDLRPEPYQPFIPREPVRYRIEAEALISDLSDPGGAWGDKTARLRLADPASADLADRARLVPFFVKHPDPLVRSECGRLLAAWGEHAALFELIGDRRFLVMKHAMYELGRAPPSLAAAQCARDHLDHPRVTSTHAYETLETYVAHADPSEAIRLLARRAAEDARETIRFHAVYGLVKLGAAREIERLLPLLEAPPLVTWGVHLALLEACRKLGLGASGSKMLRGVDNADVQGAIE